MESKALIPVQQALVPFHGYKVLSVSLPDDHVATSHKGLCLMLNLNIRGQLQRIQRDENLTRHLVRVRVETAGGPQETEFLLVEGIAEWTLGIHFNKLAPEKRPLLIALKVEAFQVFHSYFFTTEQESHPADEPAAPQGTRPATRARPQRSYASSWEQFPDALAGMRDSLDVVIEVARGMAQEQRQFEAQVRAQEARHTADQAQVQLRLAQLEQAHPSDTATREAPPAGQGILSPRHVAHLVVLVRALRAQTGEPIKAIYAELEEVFGVEDFSDLPDAGWEVVQEWFLRRSQEA